MFFIFLVCNLIIVPLCQYSYGNLWEYREGMVLGVHIPATCIQHPRVRELCEKHRKSWTLFHRINLAASFLICFVCFLDYMAFLIVWMVWLLEYVCGLEYLIIIPHRADVPAEAGRTDGWTRGAGRSCASTRPFRAASSRLALDWKWHLPILVLTAATVYFVDAAERKFQVAAPEAWPFWLLLRDWRGALPSLPGYACGSGAPPQPGVQRGQPDQSGGQPADEAVLDRGARICLLGKRRLLDLHGHRLLPVRPGPSGSCVCHLHRSYIPGRQPPFSFPWGCPWGNGGRCWRQTPPPVTLTTMNTGNTAGTTTRGTGIFLSRTGLTA